MKHSAKKILIVEDDTNFGKILKEYLSLNDYEICLLYTSDAADE